MTQQQHTDSDALRANGPRPARGTTGAGRRHMTGTPTQENLLTALRNADERCVADTDVALLASAYIQRYTTLPVNDTSLAGAMLMLAGRKVTRERAEMLLDELEQSGLVFEGGD